MTDVMATGTWDTKPDVPRCETCRWWLHDEHYPAVPNDTGFCRRMAHNGTYPEDPYSLAWAFSVEEADAVVSTHRAFGCVMHEPKG